MRQQVFAQFCFLLRGSADSEPELIQGHPTTMCTTQSEQHLQILFYNMCQVLAVMLFWCCLSAGNMRQVLQISFSVYIMPAAGNMHLILCTL